jgi:hypothetical protein
VLVIGAARIACISLLAAVCGLLACSRGARERAPEREVAATAPAHDDVPRPEANPAPASALGIRIDLRFDAQNRRTTLAFCFEDDRTYDPQIVGIRVARVSGTRGAFEIAAKGDAWLWNQWEVGTVPEGFRLGERTPMSPGEYEIYVDGYVGEGTRRLSIDDSGTPRFLPWDKFDTSMSEHCPTPGRTKPNVVPRPDGGRAAFPPSRVPGVRERSRERGK